MTQDVWQCTNGSGRGNLLGYAQSLEEWYALVCDLSDRERLGGTSNRVGQRIDAVLGDDAVQWIELFLDRSEMLYPKRWNQTVRGALAFPSPP